MDQKSPKKTEAVKSEKKVAGSNGNGTKVTTTVAKNVKKTSLSPASGKARDAKSSSTKVFSPNLGVARQQSFGPVGLAFDERMCDHIDPSDRPGNTHPECPARITSIFECLEVIILHLRNSKANLTVFQLNSSLTFSERRRSKANEAPRCSPHH